MNNYFLKREFHISRNARGKYNLKDSLFQLSGEVVLYDFSTIRRVAQLLNKDRDEALYASDLNALGLIHESIHFVISLYKKQKNPDIFRNVINYLLEKTSLEKIELLFLKFADTFPTNDVFSKLKTSKSYLNSATDGIPNREIIVEELVLLWLENQNPAFQLFSELFDDNDLKKNTEYLKIIDELKQYFETQPTFGHDNQNLIDMLRMPAVVAPNSLQKQLEYIRDKWGDLLGDFLKNILRALDFISEENDLTFTCVLEIISNFEYPTIA